MSGWGGTHLLWLQLENTPFHSYSLSSNYLPFRGFRRRMATQSRTLAWKIPWMEEPGRLQSMGSQRVGHSWTTSLSLFTFHFHALEKEMATYSSVLSWRIPATAEPGGLPSVGSHRVEHDWSDLAAAVEALERWQPIKILRRRRKSHWFD